MKLDERIKKGKKPLTPLDIEKAKEFIGELCLFSNYASYFENLDLIDPRVDFYKLKNINEKNENDSPFYGIGMFLMHGNFRYCLPAKWVKTNELKYRISSVEQCMTDLDTKEQEKSDSDDSENTKGWCLIDPSDYAKIKKFCKGNISEREVLNLEVFLNDD